MKKLFLVFLFLYSILPSSGFAQETKQYSMLFKLIVHDGNNKGTLLNITKNGEQISNSETDGKWDIQLLDFNAHYLFTCTKEGYITKAIEIDTTVPEERMNKRFNKFKCEVNLFPLPKDRILNYYRPVGRLIYNDSYDDFNYDEKYMQSVGAAY